MESFKSIRNMKEKLGFPKTRQSRPEKRRRACADTTRARQKLRAQCLADPRRAPARARDSVDQGPHRVRQMRTTCPTEGLTAGAWVGGGSQPCADPSGPPLPPLPPGTLHSRSSTCKTRASEATGELLWNIILSNPKKQELQKVKEATPAGA